MLRKRTQPPPYSFQHQLSLTRNVDAFKNGVNNSRLAGNIDSPESGLDALMQTITCSEAIGWREEVRKVIIFITDEDTHYAYDGKMAGLPMPQDNQCHLSGARPAQYSEALSMDYPSFGQIREQLNDKNMVVIFAVEKYMDAIYRELSRYIQGTENIGHLTTDSRSLERIVAKQYEEIKSTVRLQVKASHPDAISVSVRSDCKNPSFDHLVCSNVTEGEGGKVVYTAKISFKKEICVVPDSTVTISLAGFAKDALTVKLKCETCDCRGTQVDSVVCNRQGTLGTYGVSSIAFLIVIILYIFFQFAAAVPARRRTSAARASARWPTSPTARAARTRRRTAWSATGAARASAAAASATTASWAATASAGGTSVRRAPAATSAPGTAPASAAKTARRPAARARAAGAGTTAAARRTRRRAGTLSRGRSASGGASARAESASVRPDSRECSVSATQ